MVKTGYKGVATDSVLSHPLLCATLFRENCTLQFDVNFRAIVAILKISDKKPRKWFRNMHDLFKLSFGIHLNSKPIDDNIKMIAYCY